MEKRFENKIRIINMAEADEVNNVYAVCECTLSTEGIEIPRSIIPYVLSFFQFDCPRCGKALGIVAKGSYKGR